MHGERWDNRDPALGSKDPTSFVGGPNQVLKIPPTPVGGTFRLHLPHPPAKSAIPSTQLVDASTQPKGGHLNTRWEVNTRSGSTLDRVFLFQPAEGAAIFAGFESRVGDVAAMLVK